MGSFAACILYLIVSCLPGTYSHLDGRSFPQEGLIFYEIFVQSFQDSDGDGIGDLRGAESRLDYLVQLGITGIWLMPIHPCFSTTDTWFGSYNPGRHNPHGYDIQDHYAIRSTYGTMSDFESFLRAAHARQIKVILDFVPNHVGRLHPWFVASSDPTHVHHAVFKDFFVWTETNSGCCFHWSESRQMYYLGLFSNDMPDLNFDNDAVIDELKRVIAFWQDKGVDGFRFDAVPHMHDIVSDPMVWSKDNPRTFQIARSLNEFAYKRDAFTVSEATTTQLRYVWEAGYTTTFDFCLSWALTTVCAEDLEANGLARDHETGSRGPGFPSSSEGINCSVEPDSRRFIAGRVRNCVEQWGDFPMRAAIFLSNHDQDRVARKLFSFASRTLAARVLLTLPGVPFLYYGEEIGLSSAHHDDGKARRPMPWTSAAPGYGFTSGKPWQPPYMPEGESTPTVEDSPLLEVYREAIAARKAHASLFVSKPAWLEAGHPAILAYHLSSFKDTSQGLLIHNTVGEKLVAKVGHRPYREAINQGTYLIENMFNASEVCRVSVDYEGRYETEIVLQPYSSVFCVFPSQLRYSSLLPTQLLVCFIFVFTCCLCFRLNRSCASGQVLVAGKHL
eukprot:TRINITY_DN46375_c0_g1_i1.p1 TRINITY_DN46375_c0_g1~~TRINITY_DN46375_c0_g1_i1.p1  ORF type:complete len:632 (+),score=26.99 TRINITY_DN46375_c0_g1_i1:51-1898(+)